MNPIIRHRRSIRLQGYDYSRAGAYFNTLCAQNRACFFGNIVDGVVQLNDIGEMIQSVWQDMPTHYPGVSVDEFIVMPNHFHGIIILVPDPVGAGPRACPDETTAKPPEGEAIAPGRPRGAAPTLSLPDVVQRFEIDDHGEIPSRCRTVWLAIVPWTIMATKLL